MWKDNQTIALNVFCAKNEKIYPAYVSKENSKLEKQVIFFNDSKQRRMELSCSKKLSALIIVTTSKHDCGFHCFSCLYSFRSKNKLESHKKVCQNKRFL